MLRFLDSVKTMFGRDVEKKSTSLSDPFIYEIFGASPNTISGQSISPATAMHCPAVRAAVTLISEMVGALPAKLYRQEGESKVTARDHSAYRIIHDEPNEWTGAEDFRAALTLDALLTDNGFAYVNRVDGRVVELNRIDPNRVTINTDDLTGAPIYIYQPDTGPRVVYSHDQILRIQAPGGCSPIKHGREAIALALVLEQHAAKLFGAGARPSGILSTDKSLGDEAKAKIGVSWNQKFGPGGPGGTAILDEKMSWEALTLNSVDSQFLESRRFQIEEIARLFNIPVTMLQDLTNGTLANVEQQNLQFRTNCLNPWLVAWARAYSRALLSPDERETMFVEFVVDGLLAADTAARSAAIRQYRAAGVMTANEGRALLNLPQHPDGDKLENPFTTTGKLETVSTTTKETGQ